ncbi:CTB family bacteriocin [Desmonostoc muscorum LEGE 12446]|uniref:CTB family bacteriocin n=1 Tax=Desmonostoc muscorum LEGE 12446 TaxID=1828758 RepID=A0A8J7A4F1_DESMC|nr:CTB family bacteriocin [Desmonostoc muscorum]MCF2145561.1 CTB family bacteriocin [Desmonostoc muscorum LEGE 12446]
MSNSINAFELLINLSDEQQELLSGGTDNQIDATNFANRLASLDGATESGPDGSTASSAGTLEQVTTAGVAQLTLGAVPSGFPGLTLTNAYI